MSSLHQLLVAALLILPLHACTSEFQATPSEAGSPIGNCKPGQDSDGDGIPDEVEGCDADSDNDSIPNYADTDSDNDGVADGNEDLNGDGMLGCCLQSCGEGREGCQPEPNGCGKGQECKGGQCTPPVHFLCANGETDPKKSTTFAGSPPDKELPTFICHPADETSNKGLKKLQFKTSSQGQWKVALETGAVYGEAQVQGAGPLQAAAASCPPPRRTPIR